ncbi:MAG: succinylglutamate desuccinylase, partial [Candidatus Marinimicrobia bacterium]|nr:succinylglutamate desuccinylase [Candidatus Neomarinimicrobiota bacterium]
MPRNEPVEFGGVQVAAGERKTIDLQVARLFTHNPMQIPIHVHNGRRPGPRLFVSAVIHGDEIIG